jgi:colanic acid/amylovoran biosynthesis glycosyltransferase
MRVLHVFPEYLPLTMPWARQQILQTPEVEAHIAGLTYLSDTGGTGVGVRWPNPRYAYPQLLQGLVHLGLRKFGGYETALLRYLKAHSIDLLHCHFGNMGADYIHLAVRAGIPGLVSFYGFDYRRILQERPVYRLRYERMFGAAAAILCEGPYAAGQLEHLGCPAHKIRIVPMGVDLSTIPFVVRQKQVGALRLVQVAGIAPYKGQLQAVQAFERALRTYPDMHLELYGPVRDERYARSVEAYIRQERLSDKVSLSGAIPYGQLPQVLEKSQVFLHPSMHAPSGDCEGGAPVVLLDAQANGMPVIATRHCDIPSEVAHGESGLLTEEGDVEALSAAILAFAEMGDSEYKAFALRARRKMESGFCIASSGKKVLDCYKEWLKKA